MTLSFGGGEKVVQPKALSDVALRQFVKKALAKDWIREGFHSEIENAYRNVTYDDILCGLERSDWTITGNEYCPNPKFKDSPYKYEILTRDIDDVELELVIAPNLKTGTLKVVTKY